MITHVFFDFFGTLVDYDPSIHPAQRNAPWDFARRAGVEISEDASNATWQRVWDELDADAHRTGREYSMHDVAQHFSQAVGASPLADDDTELLIAEYFEAWTADVSSAPGALQCLTDLARDHTLVVVSNTHDSRLVPRLVRQFGFDTTIGPIVTSVDIGWRKPHPEIFNAALRQCGVTPDSAVFVGDNWAADVEGPRQQGMSAIYVGPRSSERQPVSLEEVPQIVRSLS